MKLAEWADKQPVALGTHPKHGTRYIPDTATLVSRSEAFHLTDYAVAAVIGGTIWFVPRGRSTSMLESGEVAHD